MIRSPSSDPHKNAVCTTCTRKLVILAYRRQPLFRLVREPLRVAMRALCWLYRVDPTVYIVRTPACYGCPRFQKLALKERSALFRWLNDRINPLFDTMIARIVAEEEIQRAKAYARAASSGTVQPDLATAWMHGEGVSRASAAGARETGKEGLGNHAR